MNFEVVKIPSPAAGDQGGIRAIFPNDFAHKCIFSL